MVTVTGANLTSAGTYPGFTDGSLLCRFGGPEGETVEATPVVGGSDDAVRCRSPPDPRQDDGGKEVSDPGNFEMMWTETNKHEGFTCA